MKFPTDIKGAMRDCILKVFWAKTDIVTFFSDNGCSKADLEILGDPQSSTRGVLVDNLFSA